MTLEQRNLRDVSRWSWCVLKAILTSLSIVIFNTSRKSQFSDEHVGFKSVDWMLKHTWASYQIRKIAGLCMRRECQERFPRHRLQRKPLVIDPGMHHGTCVTHVSWCMSGSLTRGGGETSPSCPAHAQLAILRIGQEAHVTQSRLSQINCSYCQLIAKDETLA